MKTAMIAFLLAIPTIVPTSADDDDTSQCLHRCPTGILFRLCRNSCIYFGRSNCNERCQGSVKQCKIECLMAPCVQNCLADKTTECNNKCEARYQSCIQYQTDSFVRYLCYIDKEDCIKECKEQTKTECKKSCRSKAENKL